MATAAEIAARRRAEMLKLYPNMNAGPASSTLAPGTVEGSQAEMEQYQATNPGGNWTLPEYAGSDPAYAAWLATAKLRGTNATSDAKMRRAQTEESYRQALQDLEYQATNGRKQIQSNMLGRGIFRSGETDRRKTEFDSTIEQGRSRAQTAEMDQFGRIDADQRNALSGLMMEGASQVSQAMLRDQLAAYNAQQAASAAPPAATYTATPAVPAATSATPGGTPSYLKPTTQQAGIDPRYRVPAVAKPPKVASGSTGKLKLGKKGLQ